ncbi:carboxypeptidase-like regulatory domain-containing protein [Niabella hibiscisoli]|nr:carboxypeptidase-like regulatory domain-containing protein [Niabella hibiscisoli]
MDDEKLPLQGVTVAVKEGVAITQTDVAGKFSINVPAGDTASLVFSFTGYMGQTIVATEGMHVSLVKILLPVTMW